MTTHGTSKSGPCLTNQHDRCTYAPCPCSCGHPNRACNGCPFKGCAGCQYQGGDTQ